MTADREGHEASPRTPSATWSDLFGPASDYQRTPQPVLGGLPNKRPLKPHSKWGPAIISPPQTQAYSSSGSFAKCVSASEPAPVTSTMSSLPTRYSPSTVTLGSTVMTMFLARSIFSRPMSGRQ